MKYLFLTMLAASGIFISGQNKVVLESEEFASKFKNPNTVILDVRTPDEFKTGHIKNAIEIDYRNPDFKNKISKLDPSKTYLVYCRTGVRSASAIDSLKSIGIKNLYELKGGITAWDKKDLPIVGGIPDKISTDEYKKIISSDKVVLIDFYAPWCGPCLKMTPMFEKLAKEYKGKLTLLKINADESKQLSKPFIKRGFPLLIGYKNGQPQWERAGLLEEKEVVDLIESLLQGK